MSDVELQKQNLAAQIRDMLKRVPAKVNSGSVQMARDFKRFHSSATKTLEKSRTTLTDIQGLFNQTLSWYR